MTEDWVYNKIELLEEAQRYQTSVGFLELLYEELNGYARILLDGLGARLLPISFALTDELYGLDVNQGSIDRAKEFIGSWKRYEHQEPFQTEFDFLKTK